MDERTEILVSGKVTRVAKYHTEAFAVEAARPGTKRAMFKAAPGDRFATWYVVDFRYASRLADAGLERQRVTFVH
jgi:hypothetical protein